MNSVQSQAKNLSLDENQDKNHNSDSIGEQKEHSHHQTNVQLTQVEEQRWNQISQNFTHQLDKNLSPFCVTLVNCVKINKAQSILEIGCGGLINLPYILGQKNKNAIYYATDIAENQLQTAIKRHYDFSRIFGKCPEEYPEIKQFQGEFHFPELKLVVKKVDAQDLKTFEDSKFDTIFGNLSLCHVPNPELALSEIFRVSSKGARVGFTVGGRHENSTFPSLVPRALKLINSEHSHCKEYNCHKNLKETWIEKFKLAGFTSIVTWYQYCAFSMTDREDIEEYIQYVLQDSEISHQSPENKNKIETFFRAEIEKKILIEESSLGFEALFIVARKPQ